MEVGWGGLIIDKAMKGICLAVNGFRFIFGGLVLLNALKRLISNPECRSHRANISIELVEK